MTPSTDIEHFRPGFEAWWMKGEAAYIDDLRRRKEPRTGEYYWNETQLAWESWIAAKSEASTEPSAGMAAELRSAARLIRQDLKLRVGMAEWADSEQSKACDEAANIIEQMAREKQGESSSTSTSQGAAPLDALRDKLRAVVYAASAVIERWDSPKWKDEAPTADYIARLRSAVNEASANSNSDAAPGDALDAQCFRYIEENATTQGGGQGFTISCFVPADEEGMRCGILAAIATSTSKAPGSSS